MYYTTKKTQKKIANLGYGWALHHAKILINKGVMNTYLITHNSKIILAIDNGKFYKIVSPYGSDLTGKNGDVFFIRFANSKLEDSTLDQRHTPKQLINSIVQAIEYENWELYRLNDLEMLKYMPSALFKSLKIVGAPMWEINGLPGSNKRR